MSTVTTGFGYDYVFRLASQLPPEEKVRLSREITEKTTTEFREKCESFLPEPDELPYSPEEFYEFLLRGPVIDEEQIQLMLDARKEVNRCQAISW